MINWKNEILWIIEKREWNSKKRNKIYSQTEQKFIHYFSRNSASKITPKQLKNYPIKKQKSRVTQKTIKNFVKSQEQKLLKFVFTYTCKVLDKSDCK